MGDQTGISWCDRTFNGWIGCQKVSPACDWCYAEAWNIRFDAGVNWGPGAPRRRTSAANWRKPIKWNAEAAAFADKHGRKQRVFCASLADVFDNAVDPQWRADLFALIDQTPSLDWLLLTKRIGNVVPMLKDLGRECLPVHVWLGATIVNQTEADRDIPKLLASPAAVRFLSMEPLLGPVDLSLWLSARWPHCNCTLGPLEGEAVHDRNLVERCPRCNVALGGDPKSLLDWVITGGESGRNARSAPLEWFADLARQCSEAGVAFHMKQLSEADFPKTYGDFDTFPAALQVRQLPTTGGANGG